MSKIKTTPPHIPVPLTYKDITIVEINDYKFYMEPRFLFIGGRQYFFRWLADGGLIFWMLDMDGEMVDVRIIEDHYDVMIKLKTELFERGVLLG